MKDIKREEDGVSPVKVNPGNGMYPYCNKNTIFLSSSCAFARSGMELIAPSNFCIMSGNFLTKVGVGQILYVATPLVTVLNRPIWRRLLGIVYICTAHVTKC